MGREVRMVPADWEHPKKIDGRYQPMFDRDYHSEMSEWIAGYQKWKTDPDADCSYQEWSGHPPDEDYYMPNWDKSEQTHYMMYEDTSEGTPISPAFETPEELARWLVDNNASAFGGQPGDYEHWLYIAKGGWKPDGIAHNGVLKTSPELPTPTDRT